ncbi:MAG: hypothetical protein KDA87_03255 [Planctomycetales bacterium]|nr:hypothetical protein [Planctomycetales bacterium]
MCRFDAFAVLQSRESDMLVMHRNADDDRSFDRDYEYKRLVKMAWIEGTTEMTKSVERFMHY